MAIDRILLIPLCRLRRPLRILRRPLHTRHLPPPLTNNGSCYPSKPYDTRNNTVNNHAGFRGHAHCVSQLETKPTVDDTESDCETADPDMRVRPECSVRVLVEHDVVEPAEDGLEEEGGEDNYADDGVIFVELGHLSVKHILVFSGSGHTIFKSFAMYTPKPNAAMYTR